MTRNLHGLTQARSGVAHFVEAPSKLCIYDYFTITITTTTTTTITFPPVAS